MSVDQNMHTAPHSRRVRSLVLLSVMLAVSACGGGGGGGGSNPPPTPPAQVNQPPVVQAGADQTIQLPASVTLSGSANDPENSALTYTWTATPAGVTFANASAAATTATFAAAGTYTLTLTASDGGQSGTDTLQVVVEEAAAGANAAPVVEAGADQTIELPTSSVQLQATATDDSLPAGSSLTYTWTVTSGSGVTFDDAAALTTTAHFTTAGAHTLSLAVSDGALTTTDTLQVVVNPAVFPAADWTNATPAEVGMDAAKLAEAQAYAETGGGSGFIARKGRRVHVWGDQTLNYDLKSTTKSIGGIALGLALDQGKLQLTDLARAHFPTLGDSPVENIATGWLDKITLFHLATHTSGFEKDGVEGLLLFEPGTQWFYSDGGLNWLADVLTTVFAQDLDRLLQTNVFAKIGIPESALTWRTNAYRTPTDLTVGTTAVARREFASGISANVDAMARIGLLYLRGGVWNGESVLSEAAVNIARQPRTENALLPIHDIPTQPASGFPDAAKNYGVLWWTNAEGKLAGVPTDTYWAWGLGESLIVVIPSLDLVITRAGPQGSAQTPGRTWNELGWDGQSEVLLPFLKPIVDSVQQ